MQQHAESEHADGELSALNVTHRHQHAVTVVSSDAVVIVQLSFHLQLSSWKRFQQDSRFKSSFYKLIMFPDS